MGTAQSAAVDRYFELSVLGLVSSGYLAVLGSGYLDVPTAAAVAVGLVVRALMVSGVLRLSISARVTAGLTLGYAAFYPLDYFFLSREFVPATVHLVFFLAVIKVLTAHATRDYVFLGIIGFLELLAASILSVNLTFFLFLSAFLVCGVAAFASAEVRRSMRKPRTLARAGLRRFPWRLAALTVSMSLGILVLTGGLFFLLPRTAQAAFRHLVPQRYHLPGFSNEMMLGEIGELQKRNTPVMHVRIGDGRRQPWGLKWRGSALAGFDGKRWYNPPDPGTILKVKDGLVELADIDQRRRQGDRIVYEVRLQSLAGDALFLAGTPEWLRINAPLVIRTASGGLRAGFPNSDGLYYGAYSFREESAEAAGVIRDLTPRQRIEHLQLPRIDPRIAPLARGVAAEAGTDLARARAIERDLRTHYTYTLKLLDREVPDPLANFLFERRAGHCEYFASAMAVMLRTLGIPSRVATGFQSGLYNPVSGWYVVRASDAHSWVEAFLPDRGWTTFDPTPPSQDHPQSSVWTRIGFYLDAADTFWRDWVLSYNLDRQLTLASQVESSGRSFGSVWLDRIRGAQERWGPAALSFGRNYGAAAVMAVLLAWAAWLGGPRALSWARALVRVRRVRQGQASSSDATLLYGRMLRVLKRRGFEKPAWVTPSEFAIMLPWSETATLVVEFTTAYNDLRFGERPGAAARMVDTLERIERQPRT